MTRRAFTLIELLIVVAIVTVSVTIVLIWLHSLSLGHAEQRPRIRCMNNLNYIGKALVMYTTDYDDKFPCPPNAASFDAPTGSQRTARATSGPYSITSVMFILVRDGQPAAMFRCPGDANTTDPNALKDSAGNYLWDFEAKENVGYSFQTPLAGGTDFGNMPSGVAIVADKAQTNGWGGYSSGLPHDQMKRYMSPNHDGGEMINVLWADFSVHGNVKTVACGLRDDNIYTASGAKPGDPDSTDTDPNHHTQPTDSMLIGPK